MFAPWFPTCDEYVGSPIIICIHDFIELVSTAGELCCQKNSQQDMSKVFALMKTANQSLADGLEATTIHWPKVDISLVNTSNLIEEICEVVEVGQLFLLLMNTIYTYTIYIILYFRPWDLSAYCWTFSKDFLKKCPPHY